MFSNTKVHIKVTLLGRDYFFKIILPFYYHTLSPEMYEKEYIDWGMPYNWVIDEIMDLLDSSFLHNYKVMAVSGTNFPDELYPDKTNKKFQTKEDIANNKAFYKAFQKHQKEILKLARKQQKSTEKHTLLIAGYKGDLKHLIRYISLLIDSAKYTKNYALNYENMRCEYHQKLFDFAGMDRTDHDHRESEFGQELEDVICDSMTSECCHVTLLRENRCAKCGQQYTNEFLINNIPNRVEKWLI
jgi:hypothetical protein